MLRAVCYRKGEYEVVNEECCAVCGALDLLEEVYDTCRVCGWEHYEMNNPYSRKEARRMWSAGESLYPDFPHPDLKSAD